MHTNHAKALHDQVDELHPSFYSVPGVQLQTMLAVRVDGHAVPLFVDIRGVGDDKGAWYAAARAVVRNSGALAYCICAEAWMVRGPLDPGMTPARSDRREEVVITTCVDRLGNVESSTRSIIRAEDGSATLGEPDRGLDTAAGPMVGLYDD